MASLSTLSFLVATILALLLGIFIFHNVVVPVFVYIYHYFAHGRRRAEDEALDAAGENKGSYVIKDQLKNNKLVDIEPISSLQDGMGETVGGFFEKGSIGEALGKSFGQNAQDLKEDGFADRGEAAVNACDESSEGLGDGVTPAGPQGAAAGVGKSVDGAVGSLKV